MDKDISLNAEKLLSMSDSELSALISAVASDLKLDAKGQRIAGRLAADPSLLRSNLAKTSPGKISSLLGSLTEEQKRELRKHTGGLS